MAQSPVFPLPLAGFSFTSLPFPFTYLETLLGVIGSRPPWSQVTRKLTSPFSIPPHSKFPVTQVNCAPCCDIMIPASPGPNTTASDEPVRCVHTVQVCYGDSLQVTIQRCSLIIGYSQRSEHRMKGKCRLCIMFQKNLLLSP
jgi:hypothetical protein